MKKKPIRYFFPVLLLVLGSYSHAHAYLDPFTGGILYQVLSAIFLGLLSAFFFLSNKIKKFFSWLKSIFKKS